MALVCLLLTNLAGAQASPRVTPLPAYGRNTAGTDDSTALIQNPANLTFITDGELRWSGIFLSEESASLTQGHALAAAFSGDDVPVGVGVRFDLIDPPRVAAGTLFNPATKYQWLTLGMGLGSESGSLGLSWQRSYSNSVFAHGLSSWTAAFSSRPSRYLALSVVAKNFTNPVSRGGLRLHRSYVVGGAIRPWATRSIELGVEGEYVAQGSGYWVPRGTLMLEVPYLGGLRGEVAVHDPQESLGVRSYTASVSLVLWGNTNGGSLEVSGGLAFGDGIGATSSREAFRNVTSDVALRFFREPAASPSPEQAVQIRVEEAPSARGHVALLHRLWDIADNEPQVRAVAFDLKTAPATSLARIEELRDAIALLKERGKKVLCHIESGGNAALYMCSLANRVLIHPAASLDVAGFQLQSIYFQELLSKMGVKADFVRVGAHKSAPEQFTRNEASEAARSDRIELLQQVEARIVAAVAKGRRISVEKLRAAIAKGPFTPHEAVAAGLVDAIAFDDEVEGAVQKLTGSEITLAEDKRAPFAPDGFGAHPVVAVVHVGEGEIVDGRSQRFPFLGASSVGSYTIKETLEELTADRRVGAIVLRVDSPGGSSLASDVMWRAVERANQKKPVVVSMGGVAASGGYYVASAGRKIYANPLTITGSIGIFYGKADVAGLLGKLGVNVETYKTAPHADAESIFRPFTDDERGELKKKLRYYYDIFLQRVASSRGLKKEEVDEVGQGKVWTGAQARANHLVDELGGLRQAIQSARHLAGLDVDSPIVQLPEVEESLLGAVLGVPGVSAEPPPVPVPAGVMDVARALVPFAIHSAETPLMRLEFMPGALR